LISGVPLGGIGTGKLEICPDGGLHHFTINNNDVFPLDGMPGSFLAISAGAGDSSQVKVLQTSSEVVPEELLLDRSQILYRGLYPRAMIDYDLKDLPLKVRLTAFSPIIPKFLEASSLPIAYLIFDIENSSQGKVDGSICFSWEDINGCWGSKVAWDDFVPSTEPHFSSDRGCVKEISVSPFAQGASFHHRERHPDVADFAYGDYSLVVQSAFVPFVRQYDPSDKKSVGKVLAELSDTGRLESRAENLEGQHAAVVGSTFSLWKGERTRIVFALSWYTPDRWGFGAGDIPSRVCTPYDHAGKKIGHWYSNHYTSSLDVLRKNLELMDDYLAEVEGWQGPILTSSLPTWFKEMLINQNYLLSTNMTLAKDGRFTILESPNCPCLGTLDQRFYGSPMTLLFCPELDHRELMMYAEFSDRLFEELGKYKGQIYHDFGNNRIDYLNSYGYNWIDLNPKFVLLCWRNYLYTGNADNLKEIYYKIKEVMERERALDRDGDLLPEGYGNCNTFEGHFFGANSYDGGLWLAAMKVFPKIARAVGDEEAAVEYEGLFPVAAASFEEKLWNEEKGHYVMCTEDRDIRTEEELKEEDPRYLKKNVNPHPDQCRDDQLTGSWYSNFLNGGPVNDPERVKRTIQTMERLLRSDVSDKGILIRQGEFNSSNWPGYSVGHFGSLAIHEGFVDLGLTSIRGIHDLIYDKFGMIWNQPIGLLIDPRPRGDRYMNSGSIWYALWALQGFFVNVEEGILGFRPNIPDEWKSGFVSPIATGAFWGNAQYRESKGEQFEVEMELTIDQDMEVRRLLLKGGGCTQVKEVDIQGAACGDFDYEVDQRGDLVLTFDEPLMIQESCPVSISYRLA
jgi:uncharacterized protein (DUF608 family)